MEVMLIEKQRINGKNLKFRIQPKLQYGGAEGNCEPLTVNRKPIKQELLKMKPNRISALPLTLNLSPITFFKGRSIAIKSYGMITKLLVVAFMLLGAVVVPQSLYAQCVPPPSGMVAWWSLDETVGPTSNDIGGSVNNSGTWMNSPVPVSGEVAGALSFNGSNSVDVPDQAELNFGTGDFSIDLWIKTTDASGTRTILDKRTGSVPNVTGYCLFLVNGYLSSQIGDGVHYNNWVSTGFVADGEWHHVAVTVDRDYPSGWLHYVDGSAVPTIANPMGYSGSLTNTAPFVIARNLVSPGYTFTGTLDEIELFNRVLNPAEVQRIYQAGSEGKCKCAIPPTHYMVAWWSLDETVGPTSNDIGGAVNNSGTWINNPVPVIGEVAGALSFNGSNSVDVPDQAELNFGTGDFSIDLWIKTTDASGTRTILDKRTGSVSNPKGYVLFLLNGYLGSQIGDGTHYNNWVSTGFVADGNWHHVAVTVDRDNPSGWLHYVDGSVVATPANPLAYQGSLTNTAPFVMARDLITPSHTFAGTLDEVELFNKALTDYEVFLIYQAGPYGKCKDICHADGDANNDGVGLTSADMTYLDSFINACGPAPFPLYSCDLNGDGYVNSADLVLYHLYFILGMSVFDPYGGYPVLCPCDPTAEVNGPPTLICHFKTPEGEPYPFDVTISDGDSLIKYDSVTYIATEVPTTFTMTLLYEVDGHANFMEFPLTFSPCETVELEFYAVDPNTVQGRVRTYLIGKETETDVAINWEYSDPDNTLIYSVQTDPTDRYAFVNTWIQAVTDTDAQFVASRSWNNAKYAPRERYTVCKNGYDIGVHSHDMWKTLSVVGQKLDTDSVLRVGYEFIQVGENEIPVGVTKVFGNFARIEEYTLTLSELEGPSYEPEYYYPQWTASPGTSYILELVGMPSEYVKLKYPLMVSDSLKNIVFDLTPPRVVDLQPFTFSIGGGGFALSSSYWGFTYFPDESLTVNVATGQPYCDSWGCFVLPDSLTARKIYAYSGDKSVDTLVSGADWLDNPTGEYNIVTVRIPSDSMRLVFIPGPIYCCQGMRGNANGDPDDMVDISDVVYMINYLFKGGAVPPCMEEANANGDPADMVDVGDVVYLINYLFKGGLPPLSCSGKSGDVLSSASRLSDTQGHAQISLVLNQADRTDVSVPALYKTSPEAKDQVFPISVVGKSDRDVAGVQLEIGFDPGEVTMLDPALTPLTKDFQLYTSIKDGVQKIGIVDLTGEKCIPKGEGSLVILRAKGVDLSSVKINKAVLVDKDAMPLALEFSGELKQEEANSEMVKVSESKPTSFSLSQNYPNPFNPETDISYALPTDCQVKLTIYNVAGQNVRTLVDEQQTAGFKTIHWNGKDNEGKEVASGVYFYKIQAGVFTEARKMILMK